jgi:DNA-binding transcriptional ArsR family regulator
VHEILSYFLRNPDAADSLEGIARWRLLEQVVHRTISETEGALTWLVEEGYLIEVEESYSHRLFRLNPEKQEAAGELLRTGRRE